MHSFWHQSLLLGNLEACLLKKQLGAIIMDLSKFSHLFPKTIFQFPVKVEEETFQTIWILIMEYFQFTGLIATPLPWW